MPHDNVRKVYMAVSFAVLLFVSIPYLYAYFSAGQEVMFGGFLLNPIDGYSYLAKMQQGWSGSWQFTLPYTDNPGSGTYLFMYYLLLGHISRVLGMSRILVFHVFRVMGAGLLLASLARYFYVSFTEDWQRISGFIMAVVGAGLGWIAVFGGAFTIDFWVAETYPFLSSYANAHFPLGLALFVYLLRPHKKLANIWVGLLAFILVLLVPFASIMLLGLCFVSLIWREIEENHLDVARIWDSRRWQRFFWILIASTPVILYDFWVSRMHPTLRIWSQQNKTPSPPIWNLFFSLSPALVLAVWGIKPALGKQSNRFWVVWLVLGAVLLYIPWNLQRRFLVGYYIPVVCLAVMGLQSIAEKVKIKYQTIVAVLLILSVPTNLIVLISGIQAASKKDPQIYLYNEERLAMDWIGAHTHPGSLILAAPDTGLLIPAFTGRDVIYGHPFETTFAEQKKYSLERFYTGGMDAASQREYLVQQDVDYVLYGPRERKLGTFQAVRGTKIEYQISELTIYHFQHGR